MPLAVKSQKITKVVPFVSLYRHFLSCALYRLQVKLVELSSPRNMAIRQKVQFFCLCNCLATAPKAAVFLRDAVGRLEMNCMKSSDNYDNVLYTQARSLFSWCMTM